MAATVSLHEVVDELEALIDESAAYLNRETGEVYSVREVLESEDWLPLPTRFDIHEWAIMDGFARSIGDVDSAP